MIRPLAPEVRSRLRSGIATPTVAQCVEELVLNSIDAGATCVAVRVDIANYKIQVIDNGCGLSKDGMNIIGERYATSKCHDLKDMDNLAFFGYRGEALASISHISGVLEIVSRRKGSDVTFSKLFRNGKASESFESNKQRPSVGTTITVHSVFQNLPVRRKMLSPSLDYERIRKRIQGLALIQPKVSITVKDDSTGSVSIQTHCTSSIVSTFGCLFGQEQAKFLKEVRHSNGPFSLHGFIGTEGYFNKKLQFVYVNKRLVLKTKLHKVANLLLGKSLIAKRRTSGEDGKDSLQRKDNLSSPGRSQDMYAMYVLNIDCALSEYDISLDPGKTLVEFKNWSGVLRCLEELVVEFLRKENLTMKLDKPSPDSGDNEAVDFTNIGNEDSQDDDLECVTLSEVGGKRIADLSERYGRGIRTSNCSNTLQGLTVRRGALQNNDVGIDNEVSDDSDNIIAESQTIETEMIARNKDVLPKSSPKVLRQVSSDGEGNSISKTSTKNKHLHKTDNMHQSEDESTNVKTSKTNTPQSPQEKVVVSDADEFVKRDSPGTYSCNTDSIEVVKVTPLTTELPHGNRKQGLLSITSGIDNNSSSFQSDNITVSSPEHIIPELTPKSIQKPNETFHASIMDISPSTDSAGSVSPFDSRKQHPQDQVGIVPDRTEVSKTTKPVSDLIRFGERKSDSNGSQNACDVNMKEPSNDSSTSKDYDKDKQRAKGGADDVLIETAQTTTREKSKSRMEQMPHNKHLASNEPGSKSFDAASKSSESLFLKTPLLHDKAPIVVPHKPTCDSDSDLDDENYKTPVGHPLPVAMRKIGLTHTVSALRSFRYQKTTGNALNITPVLDKPRETIRTVSSNDKPSCQYESSLHLFRQFVRPKLAVKEQTLQTVVKKPECSSTLLLPKESITQVPQLGNAVLAKEMGCNIPFEMASHHKDMKLKENELVGNRHSSTHAPNNERHEMQSSKGTNKRTDEIISWNRNTLKADEKNRTYVKNSGIQTNDLTVNNHFKQSHNNMSNSRSTDCINRPDPISQTTTVYGSIPNLKRLRNQINMETSNVSAKCAKKMEKPPNIFLTSASFLTSAQDLLCKRQSATTSDRSYQKGLSKYDKEGESRNRESSKGNIWSVIEKECTYEKDMYDGTSANSGSTNGSESTQESSKICSTGIRPIDSGVTMANNHLTDDHRQYFHKHRESHSPYEAPYLSGDMDNSESTHNFKSFGDQTVQPNEHSIAGIGHCKKWHSNRQTTADIQRGTNTSDCQQQGTEQLTKIHTADTRRDSCGQSKSSDTARVGTRPFDSTMYTKTASGTILDSGSSSDDVSTQRFAPHSGDILEDAVASSDQDSMLKHSSESDVGSSGNKGESASDVQLVQNENGSSAVIANPLAQSTQGFSPGSTDILATEVTSDHESVIGSVSISKECDDMRMSDVRENSPDRLHTKELRSDVIDLTQDNNEILCDRVSEVHVPIDGDTTTVSAIKSSIDTCSDSTIQCDPSNTVASDNIGDAETDSDIIGKDSEPVSKLTAVDVQWVSHYDSKRGQTVYVNVESGNCCMEKPNQDDIEHGGSNGRKDFIGGAGASSSVNAYMTNAGKVHPHLSHNATPFLPRSKRQRLGGCQDNATAKSCDFVESSSKPNNPVVNIMEKHLEKENQEIGSKWRYGTADKVAADEDGGGGANSFEGIVSEWSNPTYGNMEMNILDIQSSNASTQAAKIHGALHPYKFTKDMFQNIKILGQVDNKFIACMVNTEDDSCEPNLLIMIDQHAAHERIRLEQLTADAYEEETSSFNDDSDSEDLQSSMKTSSVLPPVQLTLSAQDIRLINVFRTKLHRLGVGIRLPSQDSSNGGYEHVEITHLPACMVEREAHELRRGRQPVALSMVESLIKEQLDLLQDTSGACAVLPKTITKLLNSQACHGAIKFGDALTSDECLTLIGQLSQCNLPFQCAHGRPSLIPVLDLKLMASKLQGDQDTALGKPRLWKLRKGLHKDDKG